MSLLLSMALFVIALVKADSVLMVASAIFALTFQVSRFHIHKN